MKDGQPFDFYRRKSYWMVEWIAGRYPRLVELDLWPSHFDFDDCHLEEIIIIDVHGSELKRYSIAKLFADKAKAEEDLAKSW